MTVENSRDPEALLRQVEAAERARHRGQLKIFLGYASGVGKSFRLFDEGRRRRERGEDVVVAAAQPDSTPEVAQVIRALEIIPTKDVGGVPIVDVPAVLARRPQVCLIDGLAYDNPPGSRHAKRYRGRRGTARGRHLGHDVDQSRVHRRTAGVRARRPWTDEGGNGAAGVHRSRRRGRRRRCAAGVGRAQSGAAAVAAAPARAAAHRGCRRSAARRVPAPCTACSRPGARRNASSSA